MSLPSLADRAIVLQAHAADWRAAVRLVETHGPYIVIAPGLALAHARPGPEVRQDGLSVVTLAEPVEFGHAHNDPVSVVIGLAGVAADAHLSAVADLANAFNDSAAIQALARATNREDARAILEGRRVS